MDSLSLLGAHWQSKRRLRERPLPPPKAPVPKLSGQVDKIRKSLNSALALPDGGRAGSPPRGWSAGKERPYSPLEHNSQRDPNEPNPLDALAEDEKKKTKKKATLVDSVGFKFPKGAKGLFIGLTAARLGLAVPL